MIQDLHAHTYYSFCSKDRPETVIETAIAGGIQQLGICDHNYGVACARTEFCWAETCISTPTPPRAVGRRVSFPIFPLI